MITTPKGAPSAKFAPGRTWKRHMRIEKIARLTANGSFTNEQIANSMGVHVQTIVAIRQTQEFHAKMLELASGVISEHDKDLRELESNQTAELAAMVPGALLALRNSLLSKNENIVLKAATEIMDRDGKLAKVSKVNIKHDETPNLSGVTKTSSDIMALLRGTSSFASTLDTISSFTVSAAQAGEQVQIMSEDIDEKTLADIDLSKTRPQ